MNPIEQIKSEHRVIGKAVWSLQVLAESLKRGDPVDPALLASELAFIRGFTEDCHHRKEEEVLFPTIERELRTALTDPIPEFIEAHAESRRLTSVLGSAIEAYAAGEKDQAIAIATLAEEYAHLSIEHMRMENVVVVGLITNTLLADKKLEVAERFQLIEEELGSGYHEKYEELAELLREEARAQAS